MTIHSELRVTNGEPEVWANLGDIVDWLETLPQHTDNRIAADVALEIKQMLMNAVEGAERL